MFTNSGFGKFFFFFNATAPYVPWSRWWLHSTHYTPQITLHTLHSTHYTPQITLHTLHSTNYTPHITLHTLHSTHYTPHITLHKLHSTNYTPHITLHALHSTNYTPHITLHTLRSTHLCRLFFPTCVHSQGLRRYFSHYLRSSILESLLDVCPTGPHIWKINRVKSHFYWLVYTISAADRLTYPRLLTANKNWEHYFCTSDKLLIPEMVPSSISHKERILKLCVIGRGQISFLWYCEELIIVNEMLSWEKVNSATWFWRLKKVKKLSQLLQPYKNLASA
jgi:hypothetical protein